MLIHWEIGFVAAFVLLFWDRYRIPQSVLAQWNKRVPKYEFVDVCYFCWCFWLSLSIVIQRVGTLTSIVTNIMVGAVLARFLFTVIARK